ncbi:N-carbamoylsarcosine amidohydrolase [Vreelandella neptunia]|uniref:N-carbamoylsarcosine amidohydrolase n=1 Tax=Vreelandella neptunia TaxID=115551 RepID=A0ABZ0YJY8_9GAMM|nr:N-carbamoylsarcosine amidohydrolase [Halomonas neptunia]MDN3560543.1 N-carbamoylsarcosine amidohydrolase [Halomonas neptunia]WQH12218.1 N-carbamoylsarcosine amidohydrolase [Halomonas neptunia]
MTTPSQAASDIGGSLDDNYKGVWDGRIGFGKRPALLVVDFMQGYTTPGSPLFAQGVVDAVANMPPLLHTARRTGTPVIHTNILYHAPDQTDGGIWVKKAPVMRAMVAGNPYAEFCPEVAPREDELVMTKQYASAFFGTSLASTLVAMGIDTLIITGCSTSGCIRATAVDGVQHGFRVMVVRDCVGDRHPAPHEANLFDIDSKYGDVIGLDETLGYLMKR